MEQRAKVGDKVRIIKPWMTNGRYKKGDVLTVRIVDGAGVWVVERWAVVMQNHRRNEARQARAETIWRIIQIIAIVAIGIAVAVVGRIFQ